MIWNRILKSYFINLDAPEDGGYLVAISSKSKDLTSDVVIFDAQDITKGPITRLPIPTYIPYGLHGNFISNLTFDYEETKRKFIVSFVYFLNMKEPI